MTPRWQDGCRVEGQALNELWRHCGHKRTLVVVGAGFDPRTAIAYEHIATVAPQAPDLMVIGLDALETNPATNAMATANLSRLEAAAAGCGATLTLRDGDAPNAQSAGMVIARDFFADNPMGDYEQIVVDVSALPRSVFFPLVRGVLQLYDLGRWTGDLHVIASDNPAIDALVAGEGAQPADAIAGFADHTPAQERVTRIWVPVLGENEAARLDALYEDIGPSEICPVLPFPAADPRRDDDLLHDYRQLLFDRASIEPRNFIYAAEANPYDLYRTLTELNGRYRRALKPLGETRMILSVHSSKLLSVGALLVAYEQSLEVRHVSPARYGTTDLVALAEGPSAALVVDLWLTGEPYA